MNQRILLFDIETAPNLAWVWGKFEQNVIEYDSEWYMLSWSAKWLDGTQTTRCLNSYRGYFRGSDNDYELVKDLWELFDKADIIIGHNLDRFDIKKSNTRFIELGLPPPKPYKTIDTLKIARRYFGFNSNKLDDLGRRLGVGRKVKHSGFDLWMGCMQGKGSSWDLMRKYNEQDTLLLERVYKKLLPWITNHPATTDDRAQCVCGGLKIKRGPFLTKTGKWRQRYSCKSCHKPSVEELIKNVAPEN